MLTLTDIIFRGEVSKVNFEFLKELIRESSNVRFNIPEEANTNISYDFIVILLKDSEYVDLAFDSCKLNMAPHVFVNLVLDNGNIELLFFLDLKDIHCKTYKESVDVLINWAKDFGVAYNFDAITCQPDNAGEDGFYFKDGKYGSFYSALT